MFPLFSKKPVFEEQGGGVTYHHKCDIYIDLVMHDLAVEDELHAEFSKLFEKFAFHEPFDPKSKNFNSSIASFGYVEITRDPRLKTYLDQSSEGRKLFRRLLKEAPLITYSNKILGDPNNTASVRIIQLSEIGENPDEIMEELYNLVANEWSSKYQNQIRANHLTKLEELNSILNLKPSLFGMGFNANKAIEKWIAKKRDNK